MILLKRAARRGVEKFGSGYRAGYRPGRVSAAWAQPVGRWCGFGDHRSRGHPRGRKHGFEKSGGEDLVLLVVAPPLPPGVKETTYHE
jgi:hypothetical protein